MMKTKDKNKVCGLEHAGALDASMRRLFQKPGEIIKPYIKEGMTVLDMGCGPGFFSIEMAKMAGVSGKVVAADLQEGMLEKVRDKLEGTSYKNTVELHKCQSDKIGLSERFDFILIFYMLHEVPIQSAFLKEIDTLLKPDGKILIVEPIFHVSKRDFNNVKEMINDIGFEIIEEPRIHFSRSVLINKGKRE
jgi:ubiquinone/menaquinone biosynthesis C-methylase UbiE